MTHNTCIQNYDEDDFNFSSWRKLNSYSGNDPPRLGNNVDGRYELWVNTYTGEVCMRARKGHTVAFGSGVWEIANTYEPTIGRDSKVAMKFDNVVATGFNPTIHHQLKN